MAPRRRGLGAPHNECPAPLELSMDLRVWCGAGPWGFTKLNQEFLVRRKQGTDSLSGPREKRLHCIGFYGSPNKSEMDWKHTFMKKKGNVVMWEIGIFVVGRRNGKKWPLKVKQGQQNQWRRRKEREDTPGRREKGHGKNRTRGSICKCSSRPRREILPRDVHEAKWDRRSVGTRWKMPPDLRVAVQRHRGCLREFQLPIITDDNSHTFRSK